MRGGRESIPPELPPVDLGARAQESIDKQEAENLPGFDQVLEKDHKIKEWIDEQIHKMNAAARDDDPVLLERATSAYVKACERVNEILAEEYRKTHDDPSTWELRYFKWMVHVKWIKLESPMGEFFIVPRRPRQKPKAKYWYTADELIDMMAPATRAAIKAFNTLPVRPEDLTGPGPDEKHMHIDFAGERDHQVTFDFKGGVDRASRKGLR